MSKHLTANYYQENKERRQKKLFKDIKIFLKEKLVEYRKYIIE